MKIIISKSQWQEMGIKANWIKKANISAAEIIDSIKNKKNEYFSYRHFCSSNMADYSLMKSTIEDLVAVYGIDETVAADIVQALTHEDKVASCNCNQISQISQVNQTKIVKLADDTDKMVQDILSSLPPNLLMKAKKKWGKDLERNIIPYIGQEEGLTQDLVLMD